MHYDNDIVLLSGGILVGMKQSVPLKEIHIISVLTFWISIWTAVKYTCLLMVHLLLINNYALKL